MDPITHEQAANMASKVLGTQSLNKTRKPDQKSQYQTRQRKNFF